MEAHYEEGKGFAYRAIHLTGSHKPPLEGQLGGQMCTLPGPEADPESDRGVFTQSDRSTTTS